MNYYKGFIAPLLLALIAILLVGGGAYVYVQNKQVSRSADTSATTQTNNTEARKATATINQSSLSTHLSRPTISGVAKESFINVDIFDSALSRLQEGSGSIKVQNGQWSFQPCFPLKMGTYTVKVVDPSSVLLDQNTGSILNPDVSLLTQGTLTVESPVTIQTACAHD